MEQELENKLKFDWCEMVPFIGAARCLGLNFDFAKERGYRGIGGQFAKHCEQVNEYHLTSSIPTNTLLYAIYQSLCTSGIAYLGLVN